MRFKPDKELNLTLSSIDQLRNEKKGMEGNLEKMEKMESKLKAEIIRLSKENENLQIEVSLTVSHKQLKKILQSSDKHHILNKCK